MNAILGIAARLPVLMIFFNCAAAAAADANESAHSSPGVVVKVERAVKRGASAAASGVERGAKATARGVKRAASATARGVEHGAKSTENAVNRVAK